MCDQLLGHFTEAQEPHRVDAGLRAARVVRPEPTPVGERKPWRRYVALGDSLTEGLCDPGSDGAPRGWADRLALLLAAREPLDYANLAIRSKRVDDVCGTQLHRAPQLRPDLVSILIGANDLVKRRASIPLLAARLEDTVRQLRDTGADVLLLTAFLPGNPAARIYTRRFLGVGHRAGGHRPPAGGDPARHRPAPAARRATELGREVLN